MFISPNMGLKIWNLLTDLFDYTQLESNLSAIDVHDHSNGKGVQIGTAGIANGAITAAKIAASAGRPQITAKTSNYTAVVGDFVLATSGSFTVTAPPATLNSQFGVYNAGTGTITVSSGGNLNGLGLVSGNTFLLGTQGSYAVLQSDGTGWYITDGRQDSGWITMTGLPGYATPVNNTPAYRLIGDTVLLRGEMQNTGSQQNGTVTLTTIPVGYRPNNQAVFPVAGVQLFPSGSFAVPSTITVSGNGITYWNFAGSSTSPWTNSMTIGFDGMSYQTS